MYLNEVYASQQALSQPVNCIFQPMETKNWMVAASKLHKHGGTCFTAEWPYYRFAPPPIIELATAMKPFEISSLKMTNF